MKSFDYMTLEQAYEELDAAAPQTYIEMGEGVKLKRKESGIPVMRVHYSAIPERHPAINPVFSAPQADKAKYTPQEWEHNERKNYTIRGWDKEQEIDDKAAGGEKLFNALLTTYKEKIIITDPRWFPEPDWEVVGGFDHGKTNATTLEKAYIDFEGNIYLCGEYYRMLSPTWDNNIWQNVPELLKMPDLDRMRWCRADPSIFWDKEAQADGTYTNINNIYRKQGFKRLTTFPTSIPREDLTFEERLNDHWQNLSEYKPTLFIVCRDYTDRRQPGLHPWDCPNLLWELMRMRRKELSAKQLLERNPTENIVDKDNHAWDAAKYLIMSLPKPTKVPLARKIKEILENLDPMSAQIRIQQVMRMDQQQNTNHPVSLKRRPVLRR